LHSAIKTQVGADHGDGNAWCNGNQNPHGNFTENCANISQLLYLGKRIANDDDAIGIA
jgi:hypothetical protein